MLCIGLIGLGLSGVSTCVIASRGDDASVRAMRYLIGAINRRDIGEVQRLIEEGAKCTMLALRHAVRVGDTNIINELLNNGGREIINSQESSMWEGDTALSTAMQGISTNTEVVRLLLNNGARADVRLNSGDTVFLYAIKGIVGEEVIQLLLANGGRECINDGDNSGVTPLMMAASFGRIETVELLLANGASVNAANEDGETAFMWATDQEDITWANDHRHAEVVEFLLANGAAIDAKDKKGETALMKAASSGHIEVVKLLLGKGADTTIKSGDGKTAFDMAVENNHSEVANLLRTGAR